MNIEYRGKYKGLRIVVKATDMGHRCGYVGVPKGHPLYGMHYDKAEEEVGAWVHGGLTFSGGDEFGCLWHLGFDADYWYLGFDCAHHGDAPDPDLVADEFMAHAQRIGGGHVWTLEEVKAECIALADSILARYQ